MKTNPWIMALLVLFALGLVVLSIFFILPPRQGVTKRNFDQIEVGMPLEDGERIFGKKPDMVFPFGACVWSGDDGFANVTFDEHNVIESASWHEKKISYVQRLRDWISLRK